jgi:hypothetical protein
MKYLYVPTAGLITSLLSLLAPIFVFSMPFIRWDKELSTDRTGYITVRGDLLKWLSWLSTHDERLPGGLYTCT